jgi:predicted outer membrane protein
LFLHRPDRARRGRPARLSQWKTRSGRAALMTNERYGHMSRLRVLLLLLFVGLPACDRDRDRNDALAGDTLGAPRETAQETQELLSPVRAFSLVAIEYAQMGMQRAARQDVRQFGQTVAADHRAVVAVLDSAGQTRGATLHETAPGRELANTVRLAHSGLENLQEPDFDLAFIRAQVESHRQALDRIDDELIPAATSADMEGLLNDTRAMVYAHLMRARQLLGDLLGQPVEPPPPGTTPQTVPRIPPVPAEPDTIPGQG